MNERPVTVRELALVNDCNWALSGHSRDIPFDFAGMSSIGGDIDSRRSWRAAAPTGAPAGLQLVGRQSCPSPLKE